ncbi:hypothetical protein DID75_04220 [Candidatus Marinamargulisbacteria bacterium SCGC AG-410-N11]|nr:hypothetical protein DID75_04220 [Candidatus Marinamargulisbacteria bacterium SCGC AG-410-N11]
MPKKKNASFNDDDQRYLDLLNQTQRSIQQVIYEITSDTTDKIVDKPSQDIIFDAVPIINKLKEALKYTEDSIFHYELKKISIKKQKQ